MRDQICVCRYNHTLYRWQVVPILAAVLSVSPYASKTCERRLRKTCSHWLGQFFFTLRLDFWDFAIRMVAAPAGILGFATIIRLPTLAGADQLI